MQSFRTLEFHFVMEPRASQLSMSQRNLVYRSFYGLASVFFDFWKFFENFWKFFSAILKFFENSSLFKQQMVKISAINRHHIVKKRAIFFLGIVKKRAILIDSMEKPPYNKGKAVEYA